MKCNTSFKYIRWKYLIWSIIIAVLFSCNQNEDFAQADEQTISVPIEINGFAEDLTKSIENQPHTVNRVLILPFKKIDETASTNDDNNFNLDQANVKQVELNNSPTYETMLPLTQGATYKIFAIGYNNNNYDINNPNLDNKFDLLYLAPNILYDFYYYSKSATAISDFFTAIGISYNDDIQVGEYFKPEEIKTLKIDLVRSVSGLNLEIVNIPAYVTSITLVAEKLVQSVFLVDLEYLNIQSEIANDNLKTFSTQIPVAGNVSFNHYLLPTFDVNKTKFYLDIKLGSLTERYLLKVNDVEGVSSNNSISFYPNQVVKISGDYSNINLGFTLSYSINLDDDNWDGIQ
ncbi:hypothetical protein JGH11_18880 [Dysgonomonas sp. Marseille-P4677]|uniref:hypothetical protein n=1 Tax=Dysgonomonas sp. Marseille-P4677 TaxID=2364790 RepID=UPI001914C812|nr:hypothetical protein [Dysgonomonas sp. Marseille-P4677]MBK5722938.1 hypothetical protein [Dysgonomonas sp. Marseille-P4677]